MTASWNRTRGSEGLHLGRVGTVVGNSAQIGDYPMEWLAGRVDTLREWLLVRLP
jgi:hypothetical protein